jgi:hypothetical protein
MSEINIDTIAVELLEEVKNTEKEAEGFRKGVLELHKRISSAINSSVEAEKKGKAEEAPTLNLPTVPDLTRAPKKTKKK